MSKEEFDWDNPEHLKKLAEILCEPIIEQGKRNREAFDALKDMIIVEKLED